MKQLCQLLACASILLGGITSATAQCSKDTDCKGTRICQGGRCVYPPSRTRTAPYTPGTRTAPYTPGTRTVPYTPGGTSTVPYTPGGGTAAYASAPSTGWARGAAITGFVFLTPVLLLATGSAITAEDTMPSLPLGASALLMAVVVGPIVAAGGGSARRAGVRGSPALRIVGWVLYTAACIGGAAMVGLSIAGEGSHPAVVGTTGLVGTLGLGFLAGDAWISYKQAKRLQHRRLSITDSAGVTYYPVLNPIVTDRQITGAALGLGITL